MDEKTNKCAPASSGQWDKWDVDTQKSLAGKLIGCSVPNTTKYNYTGHFRQWETYRSANGLIPYLAPDNVDIGKENPDPISMPIPKPPAAPIGNSPYAVTSCLARAWAIALAASIVSTRLAIRSSLASHELTFRKLLEKFFRCWRSFVVANIFGHIQRRVWIY